MPKVQLPIIEVGAPYQGAFTFGGTATYMGPIANGTRVVGQFRVSTNGPILVTLDTQTGSIIIGDPGSAPGTQLELLMTALQTATLDDCIQQGFGVIDFRRYDFLDVNGAPYAMPFRISWPVGQIVTVPT